MNEHDKNFLKNMSPLLIAAMVMFFMLVAYETKADDHNYTEHGIKITAEDLAVNSININSIKRYKWNRETKVLTLTLINNRLIDVRFRNNCWDMEFAVGLKFKPFASYSTFITVGDRVMPLHSATRGSMFPCFIESMTEVIPA